LSLTVSEATGSDGFTLVPQRSTQSCGGAKPASSAGVADEGLGESNPF